MDQRWDVIVVGAGLAGLSAGATAVGAGKRTLVLEAHQSGGRARTTEQSGFVFNMGAHALYQGGPASRVLDQLGVKPTGGRPPLDRYQACLAGELAAMPTGLAALVRTRLLGARSKLQLARTLARFAKLDAESLVGETADEWIRSFGMRPDAEATLRASIRLSTYASDLEVFGADGIVSQMQIALSGGVLYLDRGWSQLTASLADLVEVRSHAKVVGVEQAAGRVEVLTGDGRLVADRVVLATGTPQAVRALLPSDPGWGELGEEVSAACLDVGVSRIPEPGYVLGIDEPLYVSTQGPPARLAPPGQAALGVVRYGARNATDDQADCQRFLGYAGVGAEDIVTQRFLARMVVAGTACRADCGGLVGRPAVTDSGLAGVLIAGDWVGSRGLLADAALASGHVAGLLASSVKAGAAL